MIQPVLGRQTTWSGVQIQKRNTIADTRESWQ
jgi:hypothetical protein